MSQRQNSADGRRAAFMAGPQWAQSCALAGALLWLALLFVPSQDPFDLRIIKGLFLLGVLVIVPLGLSLVATPNRHGLHSAFYRLALIAQPAGALFVICSYFFEQGVAAALLACGWLIVTTLVALYGLVRFMPRGATRAEEVAIDAGLIYLAVGGGWFVVSRYGLQPLGFGDTIVLLTAIHFHYAGFAAPVLAGLAGRMLDDSDARAKRVSRVICIAVVAGTPLVAFGITFSPGLALAGAVVIALGLLLLAALVVWRVVPLLSSRSGAQLLLIMSSASSSLAMVLACLYAYSIVAGRLIINIPQMAMLHGVANALGFSLCGLIAWSFVRPRARTLPPGVPFSRLSGLRYTGPKYFERIRAVSTSRAVPRGLVDDLEKYRRADFDPDSIDREVRAFYEQTGRYRLLVRPRWQRGFRLGGRIAHGLGTWMGQMRLPVATEQLEDRIESRILPIEDSLDGREGVRAWVRTYEGTDRAMYVAAYATHSIEGNTYMNIAFPLPGGNVSSILHMGSVGERLRGRGVTLSTQPRVCPGGDQGVYFANRLLPVRLPVNETITVWSADMKGAPFKIDSSTGRVRVLARHEMWIFGIRFLELDYEIFPDDRETNPQG
ncbi:MAG TPA: YndJ family protein [Pyrinomonadaceae bacterium]|nr:YndJ family protein [Pyrinomonadaceae bacterium]